MTQEEKIAAANYVLTFYQEVQQLTHNYAQYENFLLEMETKKDSNQGNLDVADKDIIKKTCEVMRYYVIMTYIKYESIILKTSGKVDAELTKLYEKTMKQYVLQRADIREYVVKMNSVLMETVIKNLLETSDDLLNKIYGEQTQ